MKHNIILNGINIGGFEQVPTFEMNGINYKTDIETLKVLRSIIPTAKETKDYSAVTAVMTLGLSSGRIKELKNYNTNGNLCGAVEYTGKDRC